MGKELEEMDRIESLSKEQMYEEVEAYILECIQENYVKDLLCGLKDVPTYLQIPVLHNRIVYATAGNGQAFSFIVEETLFHKEQNESDREAEG